ncbi:MAG: hypothetical protein Q8P76_01785 [bacterium]|nr:hypothetical protein [bacterium]
MELKPKALGLTVGLLSGAGWLVMMGVSLLTGFGTRTLHTFGSFHPWFSYSWTGLVWMVILHLVAGYVLGLIFASVYNWALKK